MKKRKITWILPWFTACMILLMGVVIPKIRERSIPVVHTEPAKVCGVVSSVYFKGTIASAHQSNLYTAQPARIVKTYMEIGDHAETGDLILEAEAVETGEPQEWDLGSAASAFQRLFQSQQSNAESVYCSAKQGRIEIRSPISGTVADLAVQEGSTVSAGAFCASVIDTDDMVVHALVPEVYVQDIEAGMRCDITGEAFRDRHYAGTVEKILPYARTTQTLSRKGDTVVEAVIRLDAPDAALRSGYSARVEIFTEEKKRAVTIPYEAIDQDEENREFTYVYSGGRAVKRYVVTGAEMEAEVEIQEGVKEGELVVMDPLPAWKEEEAVRVAES